MSKDVNPYQYKGATKTIGFRVSATIEEKGTKIRDRIYQLLIKVADGTINEDEITWLEGVLNP